MNKILLFPLSVMILIAVMSLIQGYAIVEGSIDIEAEEEPEARHIWNLWGLIDTSGQSDEESVTWSLWISGGVIIALVSAIAIASASGISIIGSGLSEYTQKLLLNGILYLGIWTSLSIISYDVLGDLTFLSLGLIVWCVLSLMFVIGFATEMNTAG